jgi:hypothetical protein
MLMKFHILGWPVVLLLLVLASCIKPEEPFVQLPVTSALEENPNDITFEWTELYLDIERYLPGFRPAPSARALAYIHIGAYEVMQPGTDRYISLGEVLPGFPKLAPVYATDQIDWSIALNAYYARVFRFFLYNANPSHHFQLESLEQRMLDQLGADVPQGIVRISTDWGIKVANAVITYAETDREGASQANDPFPVTYQSPSGAGVWSPEDNKALFPFWGKARAFASSPTDLMALRPSLTYDPTPGSDYYKEYLEVANAVHGMSHHDRWVAEFWSDDITGVTFSPAARIFAIANQLIKLERLPLDETLHLYCRLGVALNDATVGIHLSKYTYNVERPVQFIRQEIDPAFRPVLGEVIQQPGITPPTPAYPSEHGTYAGVAWRIFEHYFGSAYEFTDHCHYGRLEFNGMPRTFSTWKEMAEEMAHSRIPLGVNTKSDCREGLRMGNVVAVKALSLRLER